MSEPYRLKFGVRQGGITSPKLFSLYMLIGELSNSNVGCYLDGKTVSSISYADNMVLLSPLINALRHMLAKCELLVFRAGSKHFSHIPLVAIRGKQLLVLPSNRSAK